jgi:metal-responsive CopG/Arc/MetJ family transcriptional regulator
MRTVQMTLDEDLVKTVDKVSKRLGTSRSEFTRKALREALARYSVQQQERAHREGYARQPVAADEFSVWESEQAWDNE